MRGKPRNTPSWWCHGLAPFVVLTLSTPLAALEGLQYRLDVKVDFTRADLERDCVPVRLEVGQADELLRELSWSADEHMLDTRGQGLAKKDDGSFTWTVPAQGGALEYCVVLNRRRTPNSGYDARLRKDWAVFRGDELVPAARTRTARGAYSLTRLHFLIPRNWTVATRYPTEDFRTFLVENPERRFDRPTGWMAVGEIGRRLERIADTSVVVAGPNNHGFERLEIIVLLGYTLDSLRNYFPDFPGRLAIIGAGEDMWRGALSGPGSLFIHAERPLVSENATSTLLHELVHVGLGRQGAPGDDWIIEGLAEYLSISILHATGGLTQWRRNKVMNHLRDWSREVTCLNVKRSSGPITARSALLFADLHEALGGAGFVSLVNGLAEGNEPLDLEELRNRAEAVLGRPAKPLEDVSLVQAEACAEPD